jgi:hypothetical protein
MSPAKAKTVPDAERDVLSPGNLGNAAILLQLPGGRIRTNPVTV